MRFSFIFTLCFLVIFNGCKKNNESKNGKLKIALPANISTLDPALSYDTVSATIINQVLETLYEYDYLKRPYKLKPLLAEGMPIISNNGLKYTIKIKKGIFYHQDPSFKGIKRELIAKDFVNSLKRLAYTHLRSPGNWIIEDRFVGINNFKKNITNDFNSIFSNNIQGIKAIDNYTLELNLTKPYPQLNFIFAMSFLSPVPKEAIKYYKNDLGDTLVGTGPYFLKTFSRSEGAVLLRNLNYRNQLYPQSGDRLANQKGLLKDAGEKIPFIDRIEMKVIKEAQTRWLQFISGNLDFLVIPKDNFASAIDNSGELKPLLKKKGITLEVAPTLTYWWIAFNMKDPILGTNLKLRKAISHAINVDEFIKLFTNNVALRANSIYPPGVDGYSPNNNIQSTFNLEKAKTLLKEAGYPNGKGLPEILIDTRGASTTNRQQAEFLVMSLKKINVRAKVQLNPFPHFLKKAYNGQLQLWIDGWAMDYPDAENTLQLLYSKNHPPGPNATQFSNKEFDKLFDDLMYSTDKTKKPLLKEMENIIFKEMPWSLLYYSRNYILKQSWVKNFRQSDTVNNYIKYLKTEK